MVKAQLEKAKYAAESLKSETKKQISTAIISAFALIIALSWKDPITGLVDLIKTKLQVSQGQGLLYTLYSAILVTVICTIGIIIMARMSMNQKKQEK